MIEFYKCLYNLSAPIVKEVSTKRILKYNFLNCRVILLPNPKTKKYGTDTVAYKDSQLWSALPTRYKTLPTWDSFKSEIKSWNCVDYPYNICEIIFWWFRFYKLKLKKIVKRCTYQSINILIMFEISRGNVYCENLSGECLLWSFSLDKLSKFIWEETFRRLIVWVIFEMLRKYELSIAYSELYIIIALVIIGINIGIMTISLFSCRIYISLVDLDYYTYILCIYYSLKRK